MNYLTAAHTDVGIRKKTNQDSYLICQAHTGYGDVLLAVVCDGMGGLAKGEVASARVIMSFSTWFEESFPAILYGGMDPDELQRSWEQLVERESRHIMDYGAEVGVGLGTTCVAFLAVGDVYYALNVGDSRLYLLSDNVYQITKDQTLVQRELDLGRMSYEETLSSPQRNILLQCIGASDVVVPDFYTGEVAAGQCYMLCCDGFRHVIEPEEFYQYLGPQTPADRESMRSNLEYLTELNKQRNETDNISALLVRVI